MPTGFGEEMYSVDICVLTVGYLWATKMYIWKSNS